MRCRPASHSAPAEHARESLAWVAWPYCTVGLRMRGYAHEQVAKIVGGNTLRVLENVQQAAREA